MKSPLDLQDQRNAPEPVQTAGLDCHVCKRHFQSRDSLVKPFKKHTALFVCRKCTQAFDNKESRKP